MLDLILSIETIYASFFVGGLCAFITYLCIKYISPIIRPFLGVDTNSNDYITALIEYFFVIHGLLLGLLTVSTYENINSIEDVLSNEAASISILLRDVAGLPSPTRDSIQASIKDYTYEVVHNSWPRLAKKERVIGETNYINNIIGQFFSFNPKSKNEEIVYAESLRQFNNFLEIRRSRLAKFNNGIPKILWAVVLVGAALIVLLIICCDFSYKIHLFGSTILVFYLGMTIFIIASMDSPLIGYDRVTPKILEEVIQRSDQYNIVK